MTRLRAIVFVGLLLGAAVTLLAEDLTISTYYPSPRGVYQELRTTNNTYLATQAGNVGIGTTGPGLKLQVSDAADQLRLTYTGVASADFGVKANSDFAITAPGNIYLRTYSGTNSTIIGTTGQLMVNSSANSSFTGTGNIGIGTTNPAEYLHVSGGSNYVGIRNGAGLFMGRETANDVYLYSNSSSAEKYLLSAAASEYVQFLGTHRWQTAPSGTAGNAITFTEMMRLSNAGGLSLGSGYVGTDAGAGNMIISGNVGIGTTNPAEKLEVNGRLLVDDAANVHTALGILDGSTGRGGQIRVLGDGTNSGLRLMNEAGNAEWVRIQNGTVGIGTTGPAERLDVWGKIHATDTIRADSDARFKQDLQPLSGILPKLESLHSLAYTPSPLGQARGMSPGRQLGVLGQELEQVFPELVSASGPEQYRSVDYSRLSVVLLEAIKELKQEVDVLKRENEALRRDLGPSKQPAKTEF